MLSAALLAACGNATARAPVPTAYDWPDTLEYRVERTEVAARDTEAVASVEQSQRLHFVVRYDGSYAVWSDGARKVAARRGAAPAVEPLWPEDTLHWFVRLSRWGEFLSIEPGCDPAVAACHEVPPSALPRALRHLIPRLPVWWPPRGHPWEDTLAFDDLPRPRGLRGTVTAVYRSARDTAVGGSSFWIVTWESVRRAVGEAAGGAIISEPAVEERGAVYVDKRSLVPAYAEWRGTAPPPPDLGARGATREEIRGRAVLVGSAFDALRVPGEAQ